MERRGFLRNSALAGAAVLPGMSLFANEKVKLVSELRDYQLYSQTEDVFSP